MQAIQTKFIGPTNTKGDRVKASCDAGSITVPWDYSLGQEENHVAAAEALRAKLGWTEEFYGKLVTGSLGNTYVHVFVR